MKVPFDLDEHDVSEIPHVEPQWHTDGCDCEHRSRYRVIIDRYRDHDAELWGCAECGALYWRQSVAADYRDAPEGMRDEPMEVKV